jgi:hypothetical protein
MADRAFADAGANRLVDAWGQRVPKETVLQRFQM